MDDSFPNSFRNVKTFAKSAAMTVEACMNQARTIHTVNVELAPRRGPDSIAWEDKITVQLDVSELVQVLQVVLGRRSELEIAYHGAQRDKSLILKHQSTRLYIAARQKDRSCALPIDAGDAYQLSMLLLRQLSANTPGLQIGDALQVVLRMPVPAQEKSRA